MNEAENKARQRAQVILQVRSGQITATEGARLLGVSRKTYYQWEQRGLKGMMHSLEERETGRPEEKPDPQQEAQAQRIRELEKELEAAKQVAEVRSYLLAIERQREKSLKKKGKPQRTAPAGRNHESAKPTDV